MKFPFRHEEHTHPRSQQLEPVEAPWQTLMLVCSKCKRARHGPDAREIRKGMKQRIEKASRLRVLESECLGVCPEQAITVCLVRAGGASELLLVRAHEELDALAARLRR